MKMPFAKLNPDIPLPSLIYVQYIITFHKAVFIDLNIYSSDNPFCVWVCLDLLEIILWHIAKLMPFPLYFEFIFKNMSLNNVQINIYSKWCSLLSSWNFMEVSKICIFSPNYSPIDSTDHVHILLLHD